MMPSLQPLPFRIDSNLAAPLADQVADGLRQCISSGRYKAGDILPSLAELVAALNVSQRVARDGIHKLAAEGLVVVRPRSGSRVIAFGERATCGRIFAIFTEKQRVSYYASTLEAELESRMRAAGYDFESAYVSYKPNGDHDLAPILSLLRFPFDLVTSLYAPVKAERLIADAGIPYVPICSPRRISGVAMMLSREFSAAAAEFAERCVQLGVRTAWVATYETCESRAAFARALKRVGISMEWKRIPPHFGFGYLEAIEAAGQEAVMRRFAPGAPRPDVIVAMDDYYLRGVLSAIAALRLRIPQDVRVAGLVNEGFRPSSPVPLAGFAVDARRDARQIAAALQKYLAGFKCPKSRASVVEFCDGPSLGSGDKIAVAPDASQGIHRANRLPDSR